MQTNCPKCSNRLVIDDAKVPATPFMLKCPKCEATVKLPGKGAAPAPTPPAPAPAATPAAPASAPPAPASSSSASVAAPAPAARPPAMPPIEPGSSGKALVSLASTEQVPVVSALLQRLGFAVEVLEQADDKLLRLQQGDYQLVATSRNGVAEDRNVYRMAQMLPSDVRRRTFLLLVGDEFQSGEGTQAFAMLADLVLQPKDAPGADRLLAQTIMERRRLFQTFLDTEDRKAEGRL